MFRSLTTMLPVENRYNEGCQWNFPVSDGKIAIHNRNIPIHNLDIEPKSNGFCGRTREYSRWRPQFSDWRRQCFYFLPQFRLEKCGKLRSEVGILWSEMGMLRSRIGILPSEMRMSRSEIGKSRLGDKMIINE
ncbi:MAG: hypothetical protein LBT24_05940 [Tannerella sp.]|nr:hypothetical protein [Tannerella sp.]